MFQIPQMLERLNCSGDAGDNCDVWGNPLPVSAVAQPSAEPVAAPVVIPQQQTTPSANVAPSVSPDAANAVSASTVPAGPRHRQAIFRKLANTVSVSTKRSAALVKKADFENLLRENWGPAHPEETQRNLRHLISSETDLAVIQKAHEKLAALESPSAQLAAAATCNALRANAKPLFLAVKESLETAIAECDAFATQAHEDISRLFADWGMEHQPNEIERSIAAVRAELANTLAAVRMPEPPPGSEMHAPNAACFDHALILLQG